MSKGTQSTVKFRVGCGIQTWKERKTIIRAFSSGNQSQQTGTGMSSVQSQRSLVCSLSLRSNDWEYKNENYAHVRVILTAATSPLALECPDWCCLWAKLPVCPGFRADVRHTSHFAIPWWGKGEQPAEPGVLSPLLHSFSEIIIISNCDFWDLHCLVSFFQTRRLLGWYKVVAEMYF